MYILKQRLITPTVEEFEKKREKWTTEEDFGIAHGVGKVIPAPEHPGACKENPNLIVAFLTFKPERTKAIITHIDEAILIRPDKRIIWIIGDPHMDGDDKRKRKEIMREINNIPEGCPTYEVCTFNYKETIKKLDKIYSDNNLGFSYKYFSIRFKNAIFRNSHFLLCKT